MLRVEVVFCFRCLMVRGLPWSRANREEEQHREGRGNYVIFVQKTSVKILEGSFLRILVIPGG